MALPANALTTVETVAAEVSGISKDDTAAVERLLGVASDAIERFCNRSFCHAVVTDERYKATDTHRLVLRRRPVLSIESITVDGSVIDSAGYYIESAEAGIIWLDSSLVRYEYPPRGSMSQDGVPGSDEANVLVSYTGGYVTSAQETAGLPRTIPYELEQAAIDTFASLWRRRGVDLRSGAFDGENTAIGRGIGGVIPGPVIPTLKRFQSWCGRG